MSSIPMQGVVLTEATTEKRRGQRGDVGDGTPGGRVKSAWNRAMRRAGAPKHMMSLKTWANGIAVGKTGAPAWEVAQDIKDDVGTWFASKAGGTEVERAGRADRLDRLAALASARKSKSSATQIKVPKKESITRGER